MNSVKEGERSELFVNLMIAVLGGGAPVRLAAEELHAYFGKMDPDACIAVLFGLTYDPDRPDTLWVGEDDAFASLLPPVPDRALDDGIYLSVKAGCGVVTGTNGRSVLIAAYRLLRENGCAFLTPDRDGERIPEKPLCTVCAEICEAASSRHRGVCIEGAVSYEHVLNNIRFLPKIGMNAYFFQFFTPVTFFARWYEHYSNPLYPPRPVTRDEVSAMRDSLAVEIKKRGLMYHAVGHGWTCEPFGIPGESWIPADDSTVPDSVRPYLAEVNGKRELWGGIALNTNLCYGNPETRDRITTSIADYCAAHPEIDYLHFWLADGTNNHCECPLCRDTLPSDFYVMMLNELDAKMTARSIPTHIVFLAYVDLLWEPEKERILNPDRFVLMFAPITRTYSAPFLPDAAFAGELPAYERNKNVMPSSVSENVERLKRWQAQFGGDSFDFDYHFMWDHFKDMGYYSMADLLMTDMKNLSRIGLNGMMSCQNQRVYFPTALGMHAMAAALWNREAGFGALADEYFAQAFGRQGGVIQKYLEKISAQIDPVYIRREKPAADESQAENYRRLTGTVESARPLIDEWYREAGDACIKKNLRMLQLHNVLIGKLAVMLEKRASGDSEGAAQAWKDAAAYAQEIEAETHERFDVFEFQQTLGGLA